MSVAEKPPTADRAVEFERLIEMLPAYDKRDPDPRKNYGVHGVTLTMTVRANHRAVQFTLYTKWYLSHVQAQFDANLPDRNPLLFHKPLPAGVEYHSPEPLYEGHESYGNDCRYTGGICYHDGSSLAADDVFRVLLERGSDGVWEELERRWREKFA